MRTETEEKIIYYRIWEARIGEKIPEQRTEEKTLLQKERSRTEEKTFTIEKVEQELKRKNQLRRGEQGFKTMNLH